MKVCVAVYPKRPQCLEVHENTTIRELALISDMSLDIGDDGIDIKWIALNGTLYYSEEQLSCELDKPISYHKLDKPISYHNEEIYLVLGKMQKRYE